MPVTFKGFLRDLLDAQLKNIAQILQYEDLGDANQLRVALEEQVRNNPESLLALRTYPGISDVQEYINLLYTQHREEDQVDTPTGNSIIDPLGDFEDMTNALAGTQVSDVRQGSARSVNLNELTTILDQNNSIIEQRMQSMQSSIESMQSSVTPRRNSNNNYDYYYYMSQ